MKIYFDLLNLNRLCLGCPYHKRFKNKARCPCQKRFHKYQKRHGVCKRENFRAFGIFCVLVLSIHQMIFTFHIEATLKTAEHFGVQSQCVSC